MATTTTCPNCGADSATADYCDSCGTPLASASGASAAAAPAPAPAPDEIDVGDVVCSNCMAARTAADAFCESCGLDFVTGQMPAAAPPVAAKPAAGAPSGWVAVVDADKAFFDSNQVNAPAPAAVVFPTALSPRDVPLDGDEVVIGRRSESKGFFPAVDLSEGVEDPGVSHRHAVLRRQADGSWALVDEMSTNGTFLNGSEKPLDNGVEIAMHDGDTIRLGVFTRITFRPASPATPATPAPATP